MHCTKCGAQMSDTAAFCTSCGERNQNQGQQAQAPQGGAYPGSYPSYMPVVKTIHAPSLALSIVGIVFSLLLPIVTYPCSIVGLVLAVRKRAEYKTTAALALCIIGLVVAVINSVLGILIQTAWMLY